MRTPQPRPGLTLLEMTIVLTILAVLTTLAISLTEGTIEQTRFDVTQRQLQEIHRAIVGPDENPEGPSFLSDVGRLPLVVGTDPGLQLIELWAQPSSIRTFSQAVMDTSASTSDVDDTEVKLLSGSPAVMVNPDHPAIAVAAKAFSEIFNQSTVFIRSGGSIPIVGDFAKHLGIPTVLMGFGLPDDGLHSPNEKYNLENYYKGIMTVAHFFESYGAAS